MSEETAMEITFPVQAVPKTARTGVYQHFLPKWFRVLWSLLTYFQTYVCLYLCQVLKISSTVNILNLNYLLNI